MNQSIIRPEKIRVDIENLEYWKTGTYTGVDYKYNGKPFTGFAVLGYYNNGQIEGEWEYHDGEKLGWEIDYYENGNIKEKTLTYGATSIVFYEYDEQGNIIDHGFVAPKTIYNECARLIGMQEIEEDD
ncbi:hypothetical protein C8N46_101385 [Kordia periserrulae]|uniref:MORN repeat protein n=1 Tax=Kordia periserrulae TaxID=701523 RepID=A0A2T6C628_9FLAO|nr:hypothetical protein [Kordia periserrulae]PTX63779.1 hypothetical protein C8N46_101385 [Kordia periserrulae]